MNKFVHKILITKPVEYLLKKHGYLKCDWGFNGGRYWIEIDNKIICQHEGCDCFVLDDTVEDLVYNIFKNEKVKYRGYHLEYRVVFDDFQKGKINHA